MSIFSFVKKSIHKTLLERSFWIGCLCMLTVFVAFRIVRQINNPYRFHPHTQVVVADISSWMTFDYINTAFDLPTDYLRNAMHINDSRYPKIPIGRYAQKNKLNEDQLIMQVQSLVQSYKK
ncbi:MAG TPA: hypothetical protein VEA59_02185 [Patescibacteria group bacterium]|nr:hypothetical protein [Patescibacteria group bacterium]